MGTPSQWRNFTVEELTCRCGCGQMKMDPGFMAHLETLRLVFGEPMTVTSGYRCPAHNASVSSTGDGGPHTTGKAVDIQISGVAAARLARMAMNMNFRGIGLRQHGPVGQRIVHLDEILRPEQIIWTY